MGGHPSSFVGLLIDAGELGRRHRAGAARERQATPIERTQSIEDGPWRQVLEPLPPRARALHPQDLHLTLAFLSGVDPEHAMRGWHAARSVPIRAFTIRLAAVVPMGPPEGWTALSAKVSEGAEHAVSAMLAVRDQLCRLDRRLLPSAGARSRAETPPELSGSDLATDAAGAWREKRDPLPHLTLARLHAKAIPEEREAALRWAASLQMEHITFSLREMALYTGRRERPPGQPAYQIVERAPLLE